MTPVFGLIATTRMCPAVGFVVGCLLVREVAPHHTILRNVRFVLMACIIPLGMLTFWSAFVRFPSAVMALVMAYGGWEVQDLRYWILLLFGLALDIVATVMCLYEFINEARDRYERRHASV